MFILVDAAKTLAQFIALANGFPTTLYPCAADVKLKFLDWSPKVGTPLVSKVLEAKVVVLSPKKTWNPSQCEYCSAYTGY